MKRTALASALDMAADRHPLVADRLHDMAQMQRIDAISSLIEAMDSFSAKPRPRDKRQQRKDRRCAARV